MIAKVDQSIEVTPTKKSNQIVRPFFVKGLQKRPNEHGDTPAPRTAQRRPSITMQRRFSRRASMLVQMPLPLPIPGQLAVISEKSDTVSAISDNDSGDNLSAKLKVLDTRLTT